MGQLVCANYGPIDIIYIWDEITGILTHWLDMIVLRFSGKTFSRELKLKARKQVHGNVSIDDRTI